MPIRNPTELRESLPRNARLLGLDVGTKTIGLALSDTTLAIASPLETLRRRKFSADGAALRALIAKHGVGGLVVGLPVNMDGSEGPRCQSVRQFVTNIANHAPPALATLPVFFQDERLSTAAVTRNICSPNAATTTPKGCEPATETPAWVLYTSPSNDTLLVLFSD